MFSRILIANRGEIVQRIGRTCDELGIEYSTIYSTEDRDAEYHCNAASSHCVGGPAASDSYLDVAAVLEAAVAAGVDAVHPGYGFLSEDHVFARAVIDLGLAFIGPTPEIIELMGDKGKAKAALSALGLPVLPGTTVPSAVEATLRREIDEVGFPAVLKPVGGGGGRGIFTVRSAADVDDAIAGALRIADTANDSFIVERAVDDARHIEVQVFGDSFGNVVHLYDRECSAQRLRQKVIEEAPAPGLTSRLRDEMCDNALRGAKGVGYVNAGTFEFLLEPDGLHHVIEVNTRLQVEHTVTESITGLDLVEWQIRVAAGQRLPALQPDIERSGSAIEMRLCAEDPTRGFEPSPGPIEVREWPSAGRVDRAFDRHGRASAHYDSLIAKIVTHGISRRTAVQNAMLSLDQLALFGVSTNEGLLRVLLRSDSFRSGQYDTTLVGRHPQVRMSDADMACIAAALFIESDRLPVVSPWSGRHGTMHRSDLGRERAGTMPVRIGGDGRFRVEVHTVTMEVGVRSTVVCEVDDAVRTVHVCARDGYFAGQVGSRRWSALMVDNIAHIVCEGIACVAARNASGRDDAVAASGDVMSALPGRVTAVLVQEGSAVQRGDLLCVVEAMKMESRLEAPRRGIVSKVACSVGDVVAANDRLFEVEG